jgi:hypothetical protein
MHLDLTIGSNHKVIPVLETVEQGQIVEEEEMIETVIQDIDQIPQGSESYAIGPFHQEQAQVVNVPEVESKIEQVYSISHQTQRRRRKIRLTRQAMIYAHLSCRISR